MVILLVQVEVVDVLREFSLELVRGAGRTAGCPDCGCVGLLVLLESV